MLTVASFTRVCILHALRSPSQAFPPDPPGLGRQGPPWDIWLHQSCGYVLQWGHLVLAFPALTERCVDAPREPSEHV